MTVPIFTWVCGACGIAFSVEAPGKVPCPNCGNETKVTVSHVDGLPQEQTE